MNIFKILSSYDGSINEPNVSSFLAYLLDPNEDHGISSLLLQSLLEDFIRLNPEFLKDIQINSKIANLSKYSNFNIDIKPEKQVFYDKDDLKKRRDIDIVIEISDNEKILYSICIENKITDSSIKKSDSQLKEELEGLEKHYDQEANKSKPQIYLIYLTPKLSDISKKTFDDLEYDKKLHVYWDNDSFSIFEKLSKILNDDSLGLIDPLNYQVVYLIKSFLSFIRTNFKSYEEEKEKNRERKNYGKPVLDHLNDFAKILKNNKDYEISYIQKEFAKYVKKESGGVELNNGTNKIHTLLSIVNENNRKHYHVNSPNDDKKNIFYYSDPDNKLYVRKFDKNSPGNIDIFFRNNGQDYKIKVSELSLYDKKGDN